MQADTAIRDAWAIAEAVFVRAYPLVLGRRTMAEATAVTAPEPETMRAPVNVLVHGRYTPDTLRSCAWLDLGREPLVLDVPDTRGRYYALWLRDAWGDVFASIGARTTGTRRGTFALLGPRHHAAQLSAGLTPIAAPTRTVSIDGRLEAVGEAASAGLRRAYDGFRLKPLGHGNGSAPAPPVEPANVDGMDALTFFGEVLRLAEDEPPDLEGRVLLGRLRELLALNPLTPDLVAGLARGMERGHAALLAEAARPPRPTRSGWVVHQGAHDRGPNRVARAAAAHLGQATDPAADVLLADLYTDGDGHPLRGEHDYVLHFCPEASPPAHGFWELTTSGGTPARGRSTGDLHGLALDRDGSLRVHLQRTPPVRGRRSNWLPTPAGTFTVALRLHWPRDEALEPSWSPPPVRRLGDCA